MPLTGSGLDQLDLVNMVDTFNVQEAKTRLSEILTRVENGETITIARSGKPIAQLVRVEDPPPRTLGFARELPDLDDSVFFAPLPDEELERWEGR